MRLAELKPEFRQRYASFSPETGGVGPLPEVGLTFICPKCGAPGTISINLTTGPADHSRQLWHTKELPSGEGWPDRLTVSPSIQETEFAHGRRRPPCNAHFSIINGEIVP